MTRRQRRGSARSARTRNDRAPAVAGRGALLDSRDHAASLGRSRVGLSDLGPRRHQPPVRHVQPRQHDAQHPVRAPARWDPHGNARPDLRRQHRKERHPRHLRRLHGRAHGNHDLHRRHDGPLTVDRTHARIAWLRERRDPRRAGAPPRPVSRVLSAADGVLRVHRARQRAPQRAPAVRRGCLRARGQQRRSHCNAHALRAAYAGRSQSAARPHARAQRQLV